MIDLRLGDCLEVMKDNRFISKEKIKLIDNDHKIC